jgi:hypothetical protein
VTRRTDSSGIALFVVVLIVPGAIVAADLIASASA